MRSTVATLLLSLLLLQGFAVEDTLAGHLHEKKGLHHRHNLYRDRVNEASERIRKAQANGHVHPKRQKNKGAASATYTAPTTSPSSSIPTSTSQKPSTTSSTPATTSKTTSSSSTSTSHRTTSSSSSIVPPTTSSIPTSTSSSSAPEPTETEVDNSVGVGKQKLHQQCAGRLYFGQRGCIKGLSCMKANEWFSYCRSPCSNGYGDICGGFMYFGTTCCPAPQECSKANFLWSTCQN